jgi:dihydrofolate reductase
MRKVVVQQFVTLDGYAAGPNGELDFVTETGAAADPTSGPFVDDQLAFIESLDAILLGAVTYRMFAGYWPEQTTETQAIADALNATPKIVFSSTLESAPWGSWEPARLVSGSAAEEVRWLKAEPGNEWSSGGASPSRTRSCERASWTSTASRSVPSCSVAGSSSLRTASQRSG